MGGVKINLNGQYYLLPYRRIVNFSQEVNPDFEVLFSDEINDIINNNPPGIVNFPNQGGGNKYKKNIKSKKRKSKKRKSKVKQFQNSY